MANNKKKESENSHTEIENISLETDSKLVIDPQVVAQKCNEFFVNGVDKLIHSNKNCKTDHVTTNDVTQKPNVLFFTPVTEEEVLQVTSKLVTKVEFMATTLKLSSNHHNGRTLLQLGQKKLDKSRAALRPC
jgi:hypothetical protein